MRRGQREITGGPAEGNEQASRFSLAARDAGSNVEIEQKRLCHSGDVARPRRGLAAGSSSVLQETYKLRPFRAYLIQEGEKKTNGCTVSGVTVHSWASPLPRLLTCVSPPPAAAAHLAQSDCAGDSAVRMRNTEKAHRRGGQKR